jgi:hypothetical protein
MGLYQMRISLLLVKFLEELISMMKFLKIVSFAVQLLRWKP